MVTLSEVGVVVARGNCANLFLSQFENLPLRFFTGSHCAGGGRCQRKNGEGKAPIGVGQSDTVLVLGCQVVGETGFRELKNLQIQAAVRHRNAEFQTAPKILSKIVSKIPN